MLGTHHAIATFDPLQTFAAGETTSHDANDHGGVAWTDLRVVACAATSGLWRRDFQTGSAFVTVSTAANTMEHFFTPLRYFLRML